MHEKSLTIYIEKQLRKTELINGNENSGICRNIYPETINNASSQHNQQIIWFHLRDCRISLQIIQR